MTNFQNNKLNNKNKQTLTIINLEFYPMISMLSKFSVIIEYLLLIIAVNYFVAWTEPLIEQIVIQNYQQPNHDEKVFKSFTGIMCIQSTVICLAAYLLEFVYKHSCKTLRLKKEQKQNYTLQIDEFSDQNLQPQNIVDNNFSASNTYFKVSNRAVSMDSHNRISKQTSVPLKHQIFLGFASFLSIQVLSSIDLNINVTFINITKHVNFFIVFIFISCFILGIKRSFTWASLKKIAFLNQRTFNSLLKSMIILASLIAFKLIVFIKSDLQKFESQVLCPYFCKNKYNFNLLAPFLLTLFLDYVLYGGLFWVKKHYPKINSFRMLIAMTKFTALFFGLYGLYTGQVLQTIGYIMSVSQILAPLAKLIFYNLVIHYIYAYSIVTYPPLIFFTIFISKGVFKNLFQCIFNFDSQLCQFKYGYLIVVLLLSFVMFYQKKFNFTKRQKKSTHLNQKQFNEQIHVLRERQLQNCESQ